MLRKMFFVLAVLLVSLSGTVPVFANDDHDEKAGAVYVLTNNAAGNEVVAFDRGKDGRLEFHARYDTGGTGSGPGVTVPIDPLGSQNSLLLSRSGRWLFAVNAGSSDVTVFKVLEDGLERTDIVASGGEYPVSLAFRGDVLYVLNAAGDGSIDGFHLDDAGHLTQIDDAHRSLGAATPADGAQPNILESPSQVGFSPDGDFLIVTDKGGVSGQGRILVFPLSDEGVPESDPEIFITGDPVPFAFVFDQEDHLVVASAGMSTVASYKLDDDGELRLINSVETGQKATCWIAFNGKYLFTNNTGSNTISSLRANSSGRLRLLDPDAANTGVDTAPLDLGISKDGRYLYALEVVAGVVGQYRIGSDGSLKLLDTIDVLPKGAGVQGIAVR